ncbi:hypothetical protein UYO_0411 [Lachnospiraceae bacterium JC7]|nr:hypothetical protein UYO_0411 [Lachnospiraceae bacterium JC7]
MSLTYEIRNDKGNTIACVTGYEGNIKNLTIPEYMVNEESEIPVTEIDNRAFASRIDIETVTLTDRIRKIRPYAFHSCHHLHYLSLTDSVVDYYDGALRQCQELQEVEISFSKKNSFRLLKEMIGDGDAMIPVLIHFPVDEEHLSGDELLSELPEKAVKRISVELEDGSSEVRTIVTAALTFPSYADNYEEDTFSRAFHEHIEGSGYVTRQLVTRTDIDFTGYDRLFPRFTYDEPASAVNAAFGRLMYPYRLGEEFRKQYEDYLREQSPEILPKLIAGYDAARFGHEGELIWIPQDKTRTEERIRFMVECELISEEALAPALEMAAKEGAVTTSALLMDYQNRHFRNVDSGNSSFGPELFEL